MFGYDRQNFWELSSIQSAALGLQGLLIGQQLALQFGVGTSLIAILLGNLILWIVGLAMISMTYKSQIEENHAKHALENVKSYLGPTATVIASTVLALAFLSWFTVQLSSAMTTSTQLLLDHPEWNWKKALEYSSFMAIAITFMGMGGIKTIKWICVVSFPFLLLFLVYAIIREEMPHSSFIINLKALFIATISVIIIVFPGIINLPTFFRHARSKSDAILALTLMTIFVSIFQFGSIWLRFSVETSSLFQPYTAATGWTLNLIILLCFIGISTICINIVNIYFASAVLEMIQPRFADARGYVLIGLVGTLGFGLVQSLTIMEEIQQITNCIIGSLGVTLMVGYLAAMLTQHRARPHEKHVNALCWFSGSFASVYYFLVTHNETKSFVAGVSISVFIYILVLFLEEIYASSKRLHQKKSLSSQKK